MGRLDCKEPSIVAWQALERCNVTYETLTEEDGMAAAEAVTKLGIATTPSGAAGFGALCKQLPQVAAGSGFLPLVIISEGPA